jgi:hypothetical protein
MTAAGPERKALGWASALPVLALLVLTAGAGLSATTEMMVVNRYTGIAIDGFDPVAYFVDGAPKLGRAELELRAAGVSWRFANEGNRSAFAVHSEVYMPRFGGYDPTAVARGAATAGHPELWLIERQRLYLFYSDQARTAFAADPDAAIAAAERNWPEVRRTLTP